MAECHKCCEGMPPPQNPQVTIACHVWGSGQVIWTYSEYPDVPKFDLVRHVAVTLDGDNEVFAWHDEDAFTGEEEHVSVINQATSEHIRDSHLSTSTGVVQVPRVYRKQDNSVAYVAVETDGIVASFDTSTMNRSWTYDHGGNIAKYARENSASRFFFVSITYSVNGEVYAVSDADGTEAWSVDGSTLATANGLRLYDQCAYHDGSVYVVGYDDVASPKDIYVVSLDESTGAENWSINTTSTTGYTDRANLGDRFLTVDESGVYFRIEEYGLHISHAGVLLNSTSGLLTAPSRDIISSENKVWWISPNAFGLTGTDLSGATNVTGLNIDASGSGSAGGSVWVTPTEKLLVIEAESGQGKMRLYDQSGTKEWEIRTVGNPIIAGLDGPRVFIAGSRVDRDNMVFDP